ncbi:response regulator [Magnetovibrio sp.]|uniref:response regulator n=1 Tax=Magnetovibrio sp. TaxID=2024836 RepID=UPI002F939812
MDFSALTILIVDDEQFAQMILSKVLQGLGVSVERILIADTGMAALEQLESHPGTIDLVISDIEMPEMTGFELARKIRYGIVERYRKIPFLMLTGQDTEDNARKGRIHKIDGFIVKPPKPDDLRLRIQTALS